MYTLAEMSEISDDPAEIAEKDALKERDQTAADNVRRRIDRAADYVPPQEQRRLPVDEARAAFREKGLVGAMQATLTERAAAISSHNSEAAQRCETKIGILLDESSFSDLSNVANPEFQRAVGAARAVCRQELTELQLMDNPEITQAWQTIDTLISSQRLDSTAGKIVSSLTTEMLRLGRGESNLELMHAQNTSAKAVVELTSQ